MATNAETALSAPVTRIAGIGPARAEVLRGAGIETVEDLLLYLPFRYEDRSAVVPIADIVVGSTCTLRVVVERCRRVGRGRRGRVEATVSDGSGKLRVVWFNQPYIASSLHRDDVIWLFGKVSEHDGKPQLANPVFEAAPAGESAVQTDGNAQEAANAATSGEGATARDWSARDDVVAGGDGRRVDAGLHIGRLVPIYRRIGSLTPGRLRRLLAATLETVDRVPESLPRMTRDALDLIGRDEAVRALHGPPGGADAQALDDGRSPAHRRVVCEEFLAFQTALQMQRRRAGRSRGVARRVSPRVVEAILDDLPFALTAGQSAALETVLADLRAPQRMHRLLQGDVGCGKTAVVGCALLGAAVGGCQGAMMAPTEILARQHFASLQPWAAARGVALACLTGSTPAAERAAILSRLEDGSLSLIVGTHALLEPRVRFADLGLAVVDEQHRFGVRQRAALRDKDGGRGDGGADLLVMTATPIPRTLALTVYGDLDVCTIPDMPPGRPDIRSQVVSADAWRRVVATLRATVARGEQAYVVAPRIEAGDDELAAAVRLQEDLRRQLPGVRVGLVHGAQPREEKLGAMQAFVAGATDVLAATTVVEVGVDVANATLMVIGHAETFGLAQLHQLRGRVGRGSRPSTCLFVAHEPTSPMASARLDAIAATRDGFDLAEQDLLLRGPGEVLGTRQAGLPELRVGDPLRDHAWLEATRDEARRLAVATDAESRAYRRRIDAHWARRFDLVRAG